MRRIATIVLVLLVGAPALAQEKQDPAKGGKVPPVRAGAGEEDPEEEARITDLPEKEVIERIDRAIGRVQSKVGKGDFAALEQERKSRAVRDLATVPHPRTVDALKKLMTGRQEPYVKEAAAQALGHMKFDREAVGKFLISRIKREWKNEVVLIGIAQGLGELRVCPDRKAMYDYFKHPDDEVYVSMIDCLGAQKDTQALPKLYEIFAQFGKVSTAGVNVRVDTGAAGTKDQRAAERRGRSMLQKARVDRRKGALHAVQQAVKNITGQKFEYHDELWTWMKEHAEELEFDVPRKKG